MNKFFAKLAGALSLVALVAGAGVAVASGVNAKGVKATDVVDTLTAADLAATNTTYKDFSNVSKTSSAVYAGQSAKTSSGGIQLRSKNSNSGIVSTTSGGTVKSVKITVESGSNTVDIYGSNTAYTAASDLYKGTSQGTKVGSTSSTKTIDVSGSYSYVGVRSNNGALYLTSVEITWDNGEDPGEPAISLDKSNLSFYTGGDDQTVAVTPNEHFSATPTISVAGTPSYVDVSVSGTVLTVTPKAIGSESITINAVHNTEQASATLNVEVKDSHGHVADDPFSVAEVTALIDADTSKTHAGVYVAGTISQVDSYDSTHKSITYWISDDGSTTGQFECYSGKGIGSADFSAVTDVEVGASVVVCGDAKYYNSIHEFNYNNYLVSYTPPTSSPLSSITLDTSAVKKTFDVSDEFEYTGLVVTAHYEDETSKVVSPTNVSTPDMSTAGEKTVTVSYTEKEVSKSETYTITVNSVLLHTISFDPGDGTGSMDSVQVKEGADYTLPACEFTAPEGKVFDYWDVYGEPKEIIENVDDDYEVTAMWKDGPSEVNDQITYESLGISGTSYVDATVNGTSGAVYSVNSCGNTNNYVQIKSNGSSSGIVTTTSGGDLASVTINFNSGTAATRTVSVYGKTSAYSSAADLYGDNKGTLLGEINIDDGASQTLNVEGSYQYVGVRSKSGAIYMDSVTFTWAGTPTPPEPKVLESISVSGAKTDFYVGDDFVTTGLVVTAHYDDSSSSTITTGYDVDSSAVNKDVAGTYNIVVSYEGKSDNYDVTYANPVLATYKKVESNLADFSGDCLIVWEGEEPVAMDGSLTSFGASDFFSVSITNNTIQASETREFHIAAKEGGYSIQAASGKYIGKTADSNGVDANDTDKYVNTISYVGDETSDIDIVAESNGHLRCNGSDHRIVFYKGSTYTGQKAVALYQKVADAGEVLMLDLLNTTSAACAAEGEHSKADFETAWSALKTAYNAISDETVLNKLATTDGNAKGTMFYEALARYDLLVGKYGLDNFISGRVVSSLGNTSVISNGSVDSNSAMIIITVIALTSISSIAVLLVIKRRKAIR